jgi:hypothetical protein
METMILIALGIFVGLFVASQAFARPTGETIVIVPIKASEPSPSGWGCMPFVLIGVLILLMFGNGIW